MPDAFRSPVRWLAVLPLAAIALAGSARAAERYVVRGNSVAVYDLVGKLVAEAGTGTDVVVEVSPGGDDASELRVEQGAIGRWQTLRVVFPGNRVTYGGDGRWETQMHVGEDGRFDDEHLVGSPGGRRRVTITSRAGGLDAYADLHLTVPKGKTLALFLGAGSASITNVDGELKVSLGSADATVRGTRGSLAIDAGSGELRVSDAAGSINLDTGSGSTTVRGVKGDRLSLDAGSGDLSIADAEVDVLSADTGSGSVEIEDLLAQEIALDSGSGSVTLSLRPGAPRSLSIDAGSGGVTLAVPQGLDASFDVEAGSGGIDILVPHEVMHTSEDHVSGRFGSGRGRIHIESGSGGVRIVPSKGAEGRGSSGKK